MKVLSCTVWLPVLFGLSGPLGALAPVPVIPEQAGASCVESTPVMRREHLHFLLAERDETVHRGVRGGRHSLRGCIRCHAIRDAAGAFVAVDAPGQFCAVCHEFTGVTMDCFGCHAAVPGTAGP